MSAVAELRQVLEARFPNAVPLPQRTVPQLPTGVAELDRILPAGGLPRGRLSIWMPGLGGAAVLRATCAQTVARGERAAWVDGVGRAAPSVEWGSVLLARPKSEKEALECTEELLLSGGFALVVRSGKGSERSDRVRLCKAAREGGCALVEVSRNAHMAALRIEGKMSARNFRWRCNALGEPTEVESVSLQLRVMAGGWDRESEVILKVVDHENTLSLEPGLADRRGVSR